MRETPSAASPVEVFISYAHEDEELLKLLLKHLAALIQRGVITGWYDRKIGAGQLWAEEIERHLNTAQVILLLVSADFMASNYCYGVEFERAMQRRAAGEALVIPVILRPVDGWEDSPLGALQALPPNAEPVTLWKDRDKAFASVAKGIREGVSRLSASENSSAPKEFSIAPKFPPVKVQPPPKRRSRATIEFTLDGPIEFFSEKEFMEALRDKLGADIKKIRIVSIQPGSVKITIEGDSEELDWVIDTYLRSDKRRLDFEESIGLRSVRYFIDGRERFSYIKSPGKQRQPAKRAPAPKSAPDRLKPRAEAMTEPSLPRMRIRFAWLAGIAVVTSLVTAYWYFFNRPIPPTASLQFTGRVLDAKTNGPISGAQVSVEVRGSSKIYLTDSDGTFHVTLSAPAQSIRLRVEANGYEVSDRNVALSEAGVGEVRLTPLPPPSPTPTPPHDGTIRITVELPYDPTGGPGSSADIAGEVSGISPDNFHDFRVVIYARTDNWYVQPTADDPYTEIDAGKWSATIHTGTEYAALLVKPTFTPRNKIPVLPSVGGDVIAKDVVKGRKP
jgi:hypothetical protein